MTKEKVESELTEDQIKAEKLAKEQADMRESLAVAKAVLFTFMATDQFKGLDDDVQAAIIRMSKKASSSSGKTSVYGFLADLFPEIGTAVDEFDLFKATKMGRSEMRKKVFYAMKKQEDKSKLLWIRFDEKQEAWILDAIGKTQPDTWTEADLPKVINRK